MNILKREGILLRPIIEDDLKFLNEWKNDENVYKYLGGGYLPVSIDCQKKWMDNLMDTSNINKRFIIEFNEKAVGMIGLYNINWIHRTSELGVFIGNVSYQGKGIGKKACEIIEDYAYRYLNLRKVKLNAVEKNIGALNMYQKIGYKIAGKLIDDRYIDGEYCSVLIMEKIFKNERIFQWGRVNNFVDYLNNLSKKAGLLWQFG